MTTSKLIIQVTPVSVIKVIETAEPSAPPRTKTLNAHHITALDRHGQFHRLQLIKDGKRLLVAFVAGHEDAPSVICIVDAFTNYGEAVRFATDCRLYIWQQHKVI